MNYEQEQNAKKALRTLYQDMKQIGVTAEYVEQGVGANTYDVLVCKHAEIGGEEPVMGQYFFPDYEGPENVVYYTAMLTLKENLTKQETKHLQPLVTTINEEILCGKLVIYPEIGLVYNLTMPLPTSLNEDELYDAINIASAHAISLTNSYRGQLFSDS